MNPSCIFASHPDPPLINYDEGVGKCTGDLTRLDQIRSMSYPLYGALDCIDLLLLRGGRVVDWDDPTEKADMESKLVCGGHLSSLLLAWHRNPFCIMYGSSHKKKSLLCSLPNIKHVKNRPITTRRLSKEDAIQYMSHLGVLCHVGTPICTQHLNAIKLSKFELFDQSGTRSPATLQLSPDLNCSFDDLHDPMYVQPPTSREVTPELQESNHPQNDPRLDLRSILVKFGIKRVVSEKPWRELSHDSKQRKAEIPYTIASNFFLIKVRAVINFLEEIMKISAGDDWESMRDDLRREMKLVERDARIDKIMHTIGECLEETSDKTVRISVLKLLTGVFSEKEISAGTGASRYLIRQAKLTAFDEARMLKSFQRERYNREKIILFLRFLSRPEILAYLPNSCRSFKLGNGCDISIAAVARIYSYREIYELFSNYCKELGKLQGAVSSSEVNEFVRMNCLGYSSAYKFMEVIAPNRKIRMSCVDAYQVSAFDAFDELSCIIEELSLLDDITTENSIDLRRRIRVCKSFMFGELRLHISENSNVLSHCWNFALSDSGDSRFSSPCDHIHDSFCKECDDLCEESNGIIKSYRQHVIRCVSSENDRRKIIDNLKDGEALITADYAMKLLPTDAIERQSQWYAKAGISYHMCAIIARIDGVIVTHSFGHISAISKQDSTAVLGIFDHALGILNLNGINNVHIRTDNAGNYHCTALIATTFHLAVAHNITILSHIFSEPQYGKGFADREISLSKGKLNSYIDSGNSACTPSEILQGFTHNILLKGCSFHLIETDLLAASNASLQNIKLYSSFRFDPTVGVTVRKHDGIGDGMIIPKENLAPTKFQWKIHKEGGYLSQSEHFWKKIGSARATEEEERQEINEETTVDSESLRCPEMLCISRFKTRTGLQSHITRGKHNYYKEHESATDFVLKSFSNMVESTAEAQIAIQNDSIIPLCANYDPEESTMGWALRRTEKPGLLDPEVKQEVEMMVIEQLDNGRRAEAREIRDQLRSMTHSDGSYRFSIKNCLSESQVKSQITRILNQRKKGDEGKKQDDEVLQDKNQSPKKRGRKRKEVTSQKDNEAKKKRGRPSKKSLEEKMTNEERSIKVNEKPLEEEEEEEEEINCLELMESEIKKMIDDIFDTD